jgi:hypothetical protein
VRLFLRCGEVEVGEDWRHAGLEGFGGGLPDAQEQAAARVVDVHSRGERGVGSREYVSIINRLWGGGGNSEWGSE